MLKVSEFTQLMEVHCRIVLSWWNFDLGFCQWFYIWWF